MAIDYNNVGISSSCGCGTNSGCPSDDGCPPGRCPDFVIRRHDTMPPLKATVADCDGPLAIQGLVVEVNMWALAKSRRAIDPADEYFALADNVGFNQVMINDIIMMDRVRQPEYMLVTGFDEDNKLIRVQRGYRGTTPGRWKKGSKMRIFRILNGIGQTELVYEDITEVDGTTTRDVLTQAQLVYNWQPEDTCLPGCYWLEFKILKMKDLILFLPGGHWTGPVYLHDDGFYYTGSAKTESSVRLSYDSVDDLYLIPTDQWTGPYHFFSGDYYTGVEQNDGSVWLDRTDHPFDPDREQMSIPSSSESGPVGGDISYEGGSPSYEGDVSYEGDISYEGDMFMSMLSLSVTPSFSPSQVSFTPSGVVADFDPATYGCWLGADVEWVRRLPIDGEGFLIKISPSFTTEW